MSRMFADAKSFNQPLEKWNMSNVSYIDEMFMGATSFDQSLAEWDISNVHVLKDAFKDSGLSKENWDKMNYNKLWVKIRKSLELPSNFLDGKQ